jgi:dCTP deaminase
MGVLPDHWIREMALTHGMIEPYAETQRSHTGISFGGSSYGYDFRLSDEYKIPDLDKCNNLDPKGIHQLVFSNLQAPSCLIPPHSFVLGRSLEYFRVPRDILVICFGKSTYARCGLVVNVTPFEPEWEGFVTVSLVNANSIPLKVYSGEGIAQVLFLRAESECAVSYSDKKGKYQAQKQIQVSRA